MTTDWEALLAAEGLAPVVLSNGCSTRMLELCTEPFTGAGGSDEAERQRLLKLRRWLPDIDRRLLAMCLDGATHREMSAELGGIDARYRKRRMRDRLKALAGGPLPCNRSHFLRLVRVSWPVSWTPWSDAETFFAGLLSTWSPTAAAMQAGRGHSTGFEWASWAAGSEVDERVRHVVSVVRSMRMEAR